MGQETGLLKVLFFASSGQAMACDADLVRDNGDHILIALSPLNPEESAFFEARARDKTERLGIAYGLRACLGRLSEANSAADRSGIRWSLTIKPTFRGLADGALELAHEQYSADKLAELRARRILLNERGHAGDVALDLNAAMLETFIQGFDTPIKATVSPLPIVYRDLEHDVDAFVSIAQLFCVFFLITTGAVAVIQKLAVHPPSHGSARVEFRGQRHKTYSDAPPHAIAIDEECDLTSVSLKVEGAR